MKPNVATRCARLFWSSLLWFTDGTICAAVIAEVDSTGIAVSPVGAAVTCMWLLVVRAMLAKRDRLTG